MREMVGTRSRQPSTSLVLARALSDTATLIIKDGRHVGLDFYDLLIEALMGQVTPSSKRSILPDSDLIPLLH